MKDGGAATTIPFFRQNIVTPSGTRNHENKGVHTVKKDAPKPTTTDAGIPVSSDEYSLTVGPDGPILLQDHYLIEQMANFNRERIPERQPHAKGARAFGYFEVTQHVSRYSK